MEEVAKHKTKEDVWVVVNGEVLDVTSVCSVQSFWLSFTHVSLSQFLPDHPGGAKAILLYAGRDATEEFNMLHDPKVLQCFLTSLLVY